MSTFTPRDPDFEARCRALFDSQGMMQTLGATVRSVAPGSCTLAAPITQAVSQQHGYAHAGLAWTLGDSAGGFAAQTLMTTDQGVLTVEMKINLLAPAIGTELIATGKIIRAGRRLTVTQSDIYAVDGDRQTHVATLLGTMMTMDGLA
ncbi:MAG: PaaI family thioesterase [Pseudomonadota bacterium]